jgi:hypothetical protein
MKISDGRLDSVARGQDHLRVEELQELARETQTLRRVVAWVRKKTISQSIVDYLKRELGEQ